MDFFTWARLARQLFVLLRVWAYLLSAESLRLILLATCNDNDAPVIAFHFLQFRSLASL